MAGVTDDLEVRRRGLMLGLGTGRPGGGIHLARTLLDQQVWAVPAGNDPQCPKFLPPLTIEDDHVDYLISAVTKAASAMSGPTSRIEVGQP